MKQTFDEWWESSLEDGTFITDDGCLQEKYFAAKEAWGYKDVELQRVVENLDTIYYAPPMDLPPTRGEDFKKVCLYLKNYIDQLKEELS